MEYILNSEEMKQYDYNTIHRMGMPSMVLMERAALAVVEELDSFDMDRILVVCGSGNNGGDGFAIARLLHLQGRKVSILFIGKIENCTEETRQQLQIAQNYGVPMVKEADFEKPTLVIDALFGVGLSREVAGPYEKIIQKINESKAAVVAVDMPSGISADNGKVLGCAVAAAKTVTFAFRKIGQVLYPGAEYAGEVVVKDIGIDQESFFGQYPKIHSFGPKDLDLLPKRRPYSNKGTYGKVLVIGGDPNMNGATYLSAKAAYRTGAGLVYAYALEKNRDILQTLLPEAVLSTYDENSSGHEELLKLLPRVDALVMGPGMGTSKLARELLEIVLGHARVPVVLDADALNLVAEKMELLEALHQPVIVTPHLGEMARLIGSEISRINQNLIETAQNFAKEKQVTCVLKDARTVVASKEGEIYINQSGCDAMATGGSGDVLTGIIAGLIAQGAEPGTAARLGTYLHGLAGEKAAEVKGCYGVMASDLVEGIGEWSQKDK